MLTPTSHAKGIEPGPGSSLQTIQEHLYRKNTKMLTWKVAFRIINEGKTNISTEMLVPAMDRTSAMRIIHAMYGENNVTILYITPV